MVLKLREISRNEPGGRSQRDSMAADSKPGRWAIASFPPVLERNPYQRLLYAQLAELDFPLAPPAKLKVRWLWSSRKRVRFLHFHWPQGYWRYNRDPRKLGGVLSALTVSAFAGRLLLARMLGYRIVWTIHQVYPHEVLGARVDRWGAVVLARSSHLLLAHDQATARSVEQELPRCARKLEIVPHGSYIGVYPDRRDRAEVREELGVPEDAVAFLCFGDLRAYKEVEILLGAFQSAAAPNAVLLVAGAISHDEVVASAQAAIAADDRIRPLIGFVPDDRVAELFAAADVAVLSRGDGGTSGALVLALSMEAPVVAASTETYAELTGGSETGWTFTPGDRESLRAAIEEAARSTASERAAMGATAYQRAGLLSWPAIAERTATLLRSI
jgi:beta-1,4-mannosyltransferase